MISPSRYAAVSESRDIAALQVAQTFRAATVRMVALLRAGACAARDASVAFKRGPGGAGCSLRAGVRLQRSARRRCDRLIDMR